MRSPLSRKPQAETTVDKWEILIFVLMTINSDIKLSQTPSKNGTAFSLWQNENHNTANGLTFSNKTACYLTTFQLHHHHLRIKCIYHAAQAAIKTGERQYYRKARDRGIHWVCKQETDVFVHLPACASVCVRCLCLLLFFKLWLPIWYPSQMACKRLPVFLDFEGDLGLS